MMALHAGGRAAVIRHDSEKEDDTALEAGGGVNVDTMLMQRALGLRVEGRMDIAIGAHPPPIHPINLTHRVVTFS